MSPCTCKICLGYNLRTLCLLILDEATDPWGIKVNRVELKNIIPPREIQDAMEKQMKAERERRESILRAEGEKQSRITLIFALIVSREVSVESSSSSPMMLRSVVADKFSIAEIGLSTP